MFNSQETEGLYADGVVGSVTLRALEQALARLTLELNSPGPDAADSSTERLPFVRADADRYRDGYDRVFLRADVADAYQRVRAVVREAGGTLTSSGGRRALDAPVSASRSALSFHYLGRALDLFVGSGMENLRTDPYVVVPDGERRFRVYVRAPGAEDMELEVVTYQSRTRTKKASGRFLDLTSLFEQEGFRPIPARRSFFEGGSWLGAEWWHFQYEVGLLPQVSSFGGELLRVYSEQTLRPSPPWQYRARVFKVSWA